MIYGRSTDQSAKETAMPGDTMPADLDLNVTTETRDGRTRLYYTLHSPRGIAGLRYHQITGPDLLGDPAAYSTSILRKIEQLGAGLDVDSSYLLLEDVDRKLANLGQDLYRDLFPPDLQRAYRRFRDQVRTLTITSDEPWIPWELIKPYDDSEPEILDDPFLCEKFQVTRWLAGSPFPALEILPRKIACVVTAPELPAVAKEREIFARLTSANPDLTDLSPSTPNLAAIKDLVQQETGVLHFAGHGELERNPAQRVGHPAARRLRPAPGRFRWHLADPDEERSSSHLPQCVPGFTPGLGLRGPGRLGRALREGEWLWGLRGTSLESARLSRPRIR